VKRQTNRWIKQEFNKEGKPICLVPKCHNVAAKYKTTDKYKNYCNNHNCWDLKKEINWNLKREEIIKRDNHTCQLCGDDREYIKEMRNVYDRDFTGRNCFQLPKRKKVRMVLETVTNLEVDHIIEVADGGDMWADDNLRTACIKCHKKKTKDSAKKRRLGKEQTTLKDKKLNL